MKPNSSISFENDSSIQNNTNDKVEFANVYDKLIKPQIDDLAALMISSTANIQLGTIEDLTNTLFTNLEKLDSENMIVLNGYKVVSRAYFILNCKRPQSGRFHNESNENQAEQDQMKRNMMQKQNEEILDKMAKYLETQQNKSKSKQTISNLRKDFKQYQDNVNQIANSIAEQLNLGNVTGINNISPAIIEYKNQNEQLINELQNEIKSLKNAISQLQSLDSNTSDKSSTPKSIIVRLSKENTDLKSSNESLISENDKLKKQIKNTSSSNNTKARESSDLSTDKSNSPPLQNSDSSPEQQQLLNIISQKDELINELKIERDKLKSFVNKTIFSNKSMNGQPETDDSNNPIKLKTELNLLKVKFDKVSATNEKLKAKLKKFNKLESTVEELKAQLKKCQEEQQIELTKIILEKDELKSQLSDRADLNAVTIELNSKSDEVKKLIETIEQISIQLQEQTKEISDENKIKTSLIQVVNKQSSVLCEYERVITDKMDVISQQQTEISKLNSILNSAKQQEKNSEKQLIDLYDELETIAAKEIEDDTFSNDIQFILNNHRPQDVVSAFKKLTTQLKIKYSKSETQSTHTKSEFDKLYNYLLSVIKTLRAVVSNSEVSSDQKSEILRECIYMDSFVNENAPGLREEPTIFDSFGINVDETLFLDQITSFVNDFKDLESDQSKELFSILTYVIVMNTILRKTALSYRDQCEVRAFEVKRLKNSIVELQQMNDDLNYAEEESEATSEKDKETKAKVTINKVQNKNGLIESQSEYKQKYMKLNDSYQKAKKSYAESISKYKKKIDQLSHSNAELKNKLSTHRSIITEASQVSEQSSTAIRSLKEELKRCEAELETSQAIIKKQREEIDSLKGALLCQNEKFKQKSSETIRKEKQNSEEILKEIESDHQNEIRKIQTNNKIKLARLNDELLSEKNRCQLLKNKYDEILEDLRNKLNESRSFEMQAKLEFNKKEAEIVALKGKLSALNVDNKMLKVKYANLEEKNTREKTFKANQTIAQQIAIEQQTIAKVTEIESSMKRKEQLFLQSLCCILHDYMNENEAVSCETVKKYLQKVVNDNLRLKKSLDETKVITNEITKIRSIIKPDRNQATSDAVQEIVYELNGLHDGYQIQTENLNANSNENSQLLKMWNSWARRVFTLATDTTCSAKSDKELRNMIEELVIQNSMMKNNRFIIESLRKQKMILLSKLPLNSTRRNEQSITSLLIIYSAVRRMQKMSGNLHSDLVVPHMFEIEKKKKMSLKKSKGKTQNSQKNYPLINSYE